VICDFGLAELVDDNGIIANPEVMGGNTAHLAPEIQNSWKIKRTPPNMNYSKQPSWELGVICHEIATLEHPFSTYPQNYEAPPSLKVPPFDSSLLVQLEYPEAFVQVVSKLLYNDPVERMDLNTAVELLQDIR